MKNILIGTALLVLSSSTNAAITVYTNEDLYLSDLASLGYASITESFENDTVWSDSRNSIVAPGRTSFVTSKSITWTSNYPQNEIATGDVGGSAPDGSFAIYSLPHGMTTDSGLYCDSQEDPNISIECYQNDGLKATSEAGETLYAFGGRVDSNTGTPKITFLLDGVDINGNDTDNIDNWQREGDSADGWSFVGVINTDGFLTAEIRELRGKDFQQVLLFADDFTIGVSSAPAPTTVLPSSYLAAGSPGDTWTYERSDTSQFTWALSAITTGPNTGRMMLGNGSEWTIYDAVSSVFTIYETDAGIINPPLAFPVSAQTGQMFTLDGQEFLFLTAPNITVPAGIFSDALGLVWLDSAYGPNAINTQLGLSSAITAAVTDVDWYVRGVGLVKYMGVDAATGTIDDGFEMAGTSIDPDPPAIWLSRTGEGKEVLNLEECSKGINYDLHSIQLKTDGKWRMESPSGNYSGKYEVVKPGEKLSLLLSKNSKSRLYEYIGQAGKSLCNVKKKVLSPKIDKFIIKLDDENETLKVVLKVKYKAISLPSFFSGNNLFILSLPFNGKDTCSSTLGT